tara:strand:+ start:6715 stop:7479 length:765 start_codon:yes stop_codon:yes gene_type:complete
MTISQIKYLRSLHNKKYRQKEKKIILEGKKLINQVLNSNTKIECVWLSHAFIESTSGQELKLKLSKKNINWEVASEKSIARVCESKNNQGLVAISPLPEFNKINPFPNQAIYLDGISDPGNMGTILRSAIWFGIKTILLSNDCVDPFNSKVIRSGMGSHFYFNHIITKSASDVLMKFDKSYRILGADIKGEPMHLKNFEKHKKWVLVLGNESKGLSEKLRLKLTDEIYIDGFHQIDSLNVAVAGSIILHKLVTR